MKREIKVAPFNSLIFVMDHTTGIIPDKMGGGLVAATSSCIAIGTLSEHDGETSITLSDEGTPPGFGGKPVFEGVISTPSKTLSVCSVLNDTLISMEVPSNNTHVQVWANDTFEPDRIVIIVLL